MSLLNSLTFLLVVGLSVANAVPSKPQQNDLEPITLDDILNGRLGAGGFSGQWVSDNLIRITQSEQIVEYNIINGTSRTVVNITAVKQQLPPESAYSGLNFSPNGKYALVEHGRLSLWRYSTLAKYDILNVESGQIISKLIPSGGDPNQQETLQLVQWSPNGDGVAFVHKYNIYYRPNVTQPDVRQITTDGEDEEKAIYNGIADWVYEEEMFGGPTAMWISPTGKNIAFVKFNDSEVQQFQWPMYGEPGAETVYPEYRNIRYPKSGTKNPDAHVYVRSLSDPNSQAVKVNYPNTEAGDTHLIGRVGWATDDKLLVVTLNRNQTTSQFHLCNTTQTPVQGNRIYTYQLEHGWVDINTPRISKDGGSFLFMRSVKQENSDESYNHIVQVELVQGGQEKIITTGKLSVGSVLGWDETNHRIYFSGSGTNGTHVDATISQVYSIADQPASNATCITCELKNEAEESCLENSVQFSTNFTHFIHRCSGPGVPETTTRLTQGGNTVTNPGPTFVNNKALRDRLKTKAVPSRREYLVKVGANGRFTARVRLQLPANFQETQTYPLLISVYGGPGSKALGQGFGFQWETSLVSDKNIIFGQIDGRGTSGQSSEHMFELHRKLGAAEMEDQITATKWLVENLSFIDGNKTAIWGWSYGGYATVKTLELDTAHVFKCGISVAPVTSWRYYDTIYTERYMSLPTQEDNLQSYKDSDTTSKEAVENLKNKLLMLVHGNADDNVHYQQSMILSRAMEQNDVFFHQLSYPDENHGIGGRGMRLHLYHSLQRFLFDECYVDGEKDQEEGPTTTTPGAHESTTSSGPAKNSFPILSMMICAFGWLRFAS